MATTYTTNYNLGKQTDHADKFDMSVITDNADKIDTALKENADAISSKQDILNVAQLAAVNSGITSEDVAQIETNKNNILYAQKTGVKNIMDLSKYKELNPSIVVGDNLVFHGITWSISNSSGLTVSGTADSSGSYPTIYSATLPIGTYYLTGGDSTVELLAPNNQHESGQGLTIEITASTTQPYIIRGYVPQSTAITGTHNIKPMLRQVGDSTFEPYAMSNAELTAAEKQNESNILTGLTLVAHMSANGSTSLSYDTNINDFNIGGANSDKSSGSYLVICTNWSTTPAPYVGLLTFSGATSNNFVKTDIVTGFTPTITITQNVANATIAISGAAKISIYATK